MLELTQNDLSYDLEKLLSEAEACVKDGSGLIQYGTGIYAVVSVLRRAVVAERKLNKLESAIRKHRDAQGHDKCHQNNVELWSTLGEPLPNQMWPPEQEFFEECKRYYFENNPNASKS